MDGCGIKSSVIGRSDGGDVTGSTCKEGGTEGGREGRRDTERKRGKERSVCVKRGRFNGGEFTGHTCVDLHD